MNKCTQLQVILLRNRAEPDTDVYADTLRLAFEGTANQENPGNTYLDDAVDLQIQVLDLPEIPGESALKPLLGGARHSVLVIVDIPGNKKALYQESEQLRKKVGQDNVVEIQIPNPQIQGNIQQHSTDPTGIEPSLLPVAVALRAMECARLALQRNIAKNDQTAQVGPEPKQFKFFLSHAKIDGVPMAISQVGLMRRLQAASTRSFNYFYDVEHILPGDDWRKVLEDNAKNAVLIALRTEEYEKRYWCQREYLWAETQRMPILVVDLRAAQYHASARLPFDVAPTVKVHDGNLIRVVLHAIACHVRMLRIQSRIGDDLNHYEVLAHKPSQYSLYGAIGGLMYRLKANAKATIVYPNPRLPDDYLEAVKPMLETSGLNIELLAYDEL